MDQIKDVLQSVIHDLMKQKKGVDFQKARDVLKKAIGAKAFAHTQIVYLTKDKIRVNVDSSSRLYDLNLRKERIAREISEALQIKDIRFRLGDITKPRARLIRG
ncbi:MAG: DciA family protein [Candidatus Omnitrophota bacterium]